jgi:hypothetical protein
MFLFDIKFIIKKIAQGNKSILAKELKQYYIDDKCIIIKKQKFDVELLCKKIIN